MPTPQGWEGYDAYTSRKGGKLCLLVGVRRKVETRGLTKWFWPTIFSHFDEGCLMAQQSYTPAREECNKCDLTGF